jgi:predicted membrane-bound spermidine synthase
MPAVSDQLAVQRFSSLRTRRIGIYFAFFVVSGFCGLVYEVVWLRLAMASFGVNTALVSIVVSVFMAGLGLGCWTTGYLLRTSDKCHTFPLKLYAVAELAVGFSSVLVPLEFKVGRLLLLHVSTFAAWQSSRYYVLVGAWIVFTLLPWCTCMGATVPLLMAVIKKDSEAQAKRSFSFLYMANVLGALLGTLTSAFVLIELVGFSKTLYLAGSLNLLLTISALLISGSRARDEAIEGSAPRSSPHSKPYGLPDKVVLTLLFVPGAVSMGLEVIWIRQFTPYLGNVVYAFAGILAVYLFSTFVGSQDYRSWICSHSVDESAPAWALLAVFAVLPVIAADPQVPVRLGPVELGGLRLSAIVLFCALCGFLTPLLVDSWSAGDPTRAAKAYATNIAGSILGPLLAGFVLLPHLGERFSTMLLTAPLFAIAALTCLRKTGATPPRSNAKVGPKTKLFLATAVAALIFVFSHDYETIFPAHKVRRDYTATVVAANEGWSRTLLINGIGMTALTPDTKFMAHLPAAFMARTPNKALVICFGMGTTFRSMLSWGVPTTAVDLVPSVPEMFSYYHADAEAVSNSPLARIVIDDGRRFLDGSSETYDLIIVDPPPPPSAPGSSLLYSGEFYDIVKRRLAQDGILQMWHPTVEGDPATAAAVTKSLTDSFPFVRAFVSVDGYGVHYLASMHPIPVLSSSTLAARLPARAVSDFAEWGPRHTAEEQFHEVLSREVEIHRLLNLSPRTPPITDNQPINEYYLLRNWFHYYR